MRTSLKRIAPLAALLFVGGCADAIDHDMKVPTTFADGAANHPISVGPNYVNLKVPGGELALQDSSRLERFVTDYLARGNGQLSISVPRGPASSDAIGHISDELTEMGVPRAHIAAATRDSAGGDTNIELSYVAYTAHTDSCGDWSKDADDTAENLPMPDFGCAVQHNVAAMVADPRDLASPRTMSPADATRRATAIKQYETGKTTAAEKTKEQSGSVSDAASGGSSGSQ